MKTTCTIGTPVYQIHLPEDWFGHEDQDYTKNHYYPVGHQWAGQVEKQEECNHDVEAMYSALMQLNHGKLESIVMPNLNCSFTIETDTPLARVKQIVNRTLSLLVERRRRRDVMIKDIRRVGYKIVSEDWMEVEWKIGGHDIFTETSGPYAPDRPIHDQIAEQRPDAIDYLKFECTKWVAVND